MTRGSRRGAVWHVGHSRPWHAGGGAAAAEAIVRSRADGLGEKLQTAVLWVDVRFMIPDCMKRLAVRGARGLGRYQPRTADELRCLQGEPVGFEGDIPMGSGAVRDQRPLVYASLPPAVESVSDIVYTPAGMAWVGGKLIERYSARQPWPQDLRFFSASKARQTLDAACVVQAETPLSYGDFFSEHMATLASAGELPAPLLLPASIGNRAYVRRDLDRIGVSYTVVDAPVRIRQAHVLRKRRPHHNWRADEVHALRDHLGDPSMRPIPGSIVYLSRAGEKSDAVNRDYPNEILEAVLARRGATIVRCKQTNAAGYEALRHKADIVIADHGAALSNLLRWNPSTVIELVTTHWTNCFLLMIAHMNINRYGIIDVRDIDEAAFTRKLDALLTERHALAA
ncbi:MAG TPA: glycosyltransferase family 61 protein [Tepidisphaeraceae bacterium]|jgi:capsular polysaccharide biosynthesis protein